MLAGTQHPQAIHARPLRLRVFFDAHPATEKGPGSALPVGVAGLRRAFVNDSAALAPGTRPQLDQMIGRAHGLRIVLDHDDRIPPVPQVAERLDQTAIIQRVQADTRLIQNINHPD